MAKGDTVIPAGRKLVIEFPGGGGLGPSSERDPKAKARDKKLGYVN
jgi:N-methylhydantoinase B